MADFFKGKRSWKLLNSKSWSEWCWMEHLCTWIYEWFTNNLCVLAQFCFSLNISLGTCSIFFQLKIWPNFGFESLPSNLHHRRTFFFKVSTTISYGFTPPIFLVLMIYIITPPWHLPFRCFKVLLEVVEGSPTGAHQLRPLQTLHPFSPIHHRTHAAHGTGFTRGSHLRRKACWIFVSKSCDMKWR